MPDTDLTIIPGNDVGIIKPDQVLDVAIAAAKALTRVVSQKKKPVIINGEQYLEYEDWQTLGQFYGVTAITGDAVLVEIDGVKGAKATAKLIKLSTGEIIGGAEAYCMRDEDKWGSRAKYEYQDGKRIKVGEEPVPWFQLASMAQTRAGSKALRNRLAWIAVLGGYRPTPAEEMAGVETTPIDKTEHWCKEHDTNFFMKGKMKAFAHPIGDSGEWCHEHSQKPAEVIDSTATEIKEPPASAQSQDEAFKKLGYDEDPSTTPAPKVPESKQESKVKRDPRTMRDSTGFFKAGKDDYKLSPQQMLKMVNVTSTSELGSLSEAYESIQKQMEV